VIARLLLALLVLLGLKAAAWALADGAVTADFLTGLTIFDAAALFVAPSWIAMAGANRASGPLRTFVTVPAVQLVLIGSNLVMQAVAIFGGTANLLGAISRLGGQALTRSMLGGVPGALALWLIATMVAFAYVAVRMRFVPTQTDRRRAAAFVAAHYSARLSRSPGQPADDQPESAAPAEPETERPSATAAR
jgi:hypothetical protein